jgi:hypothetical protein
MEKYSMTKHIAIIGTLLTGSLVYGAAAVDVFPQLGKTPGTFRFIINADPHASREKPGQTPPNIHNQYLRDFVSEVNGMSPQPAFVIFNGDIYERGGAPQTTDTLMGIVKGMKPLAIAVTGNHDVRADDVDEVFRPVQKAFNGTTDYTFSFNAGQWHFVIMPTRELLDTAEKEQAFLNWLDKDLKANRTRPTMAFHHYHLLPVGTSQLEFYVYSIDYKNRLLDTLTRYGNVKYVFSGHVHAGIQPSVKTAWQYKGAKFIIAPSPVQPRPFGEEYPEFTMEGGYYLVVDVHGADVRLLGRQIRGKGEHLYPASFREFSKTIDPRNMTAAWELPAAKTLENGGFEQGLKSWNAPYRYMADTDPGYGWKAVEDKKASGERSARIFVREKGQGWAIGEFSEIYQFTQLPPNAAPALDLKYNPGAATSGGGYFWIGGFHGKEARTAMLFQWGPKMSSKHTLFRSMTYVMNAGKAPSEGIELIGRRNKSVFWTLPSEANQWHNVSIDLSKAMDEATGQAGAFRALGVDRIIIGLGSWCAAGAGSKSEAWFDDISLRVDGKGSMTIDGKPFDARRNGTDLVIESEAAPKKRAAGR